MTRGWLLIRNIYSGVRVTIMSNPEDKNNCKIISEKVGRKSILWKNWESKKTSLSFDLKQRIIIKKIKTIAKIRSVRKFLVSSTKILFLSRYNVFKKREKRKERIEKTIFAEKKARLSIYTLYIPIDKTRARTWDKNS